jgi:hypothetical protein
MFSFLCTTSSHKESIVRRILTIHLLIASRSCKRPCKGVQGDRIVGYLVTTVSGVSDSNDLKNA